MTGYAGVNRKTFIYFTLLAVVTLIAKNNAGIF
jgi:hypothetical protein